MGVKCRPLTENSLSRRPDIRSRASELRSESGTGSSARVGWVLWRNREALPDELVFEVDHLGGETPTTAIDFSRPGAQVVARYSSFPRPGLPPARSPGRLSPL